MFDIQPVTIYVLFQSWLDAHRARDDRGASLVEYALLVALIAIVCIVAITFLGESSSSQFDTAGSSIAG